MRTNHDCCQQLQPRATRGGRTIGMLLGRNLEYGGESFEVLFYHGSDHIGDLPVQPSQPRCTSTCSKPDGRGRGAEMGRKERTCWLMRTIAISCLSVNSAKAASIVATDVSVGRSHIKSAGIPRRHTLADQETGLRWSGRGGGTTRTYWHLQRESSFCPDHQCDLFLPRAHR